MVRRDSTCKITVGDLEKSGAVNIDLWKRKFQAKVKNVRLVIMDGENGDK